MRTSASHHPLTLLLAATVALLCWASGPALAAGCTPGAVDRPDLSYADTNCDGIDGDKATAIFVAPNGSDANDGSFGHPMASVTAAVTAGLAGGRDVYVAAGTYTGKVAFLGSGGHIGVYGGVRTPVVRSTAGVTPRALCGCEREDECLMAATKRYTPEQIVAKFREHETLQGQGLTIPQAWQRGARE